MPLAVAVQSLVATASSGNQYDVVVLSHGVDGSVRDEIVSLAAGHGNITIRFVDVTSRLEHLAGAMYLGPDQAFSAACYGRFLIPEVFANYAKVVYLDCDLILKADVAVLYATDLGDKLLAAATDVTIAILRKQYPDTFGDYIASKLGMRRPERYFNSGVMVCNVAKMRASGFQHQCVERLLQVKEPTFYDQCILNSLIDGDHVTLSLDWNLTVNALVHDKRHGLCPPGQMSQALVAAYERPKIIHYAGPDKPWSVGGWKNELSHQWWVLAAMTPCVDRLLERLETDIRAVEADRARVISHSTKISLLGIPIIKLRRKEASTAYYLFSVIKIAAIKHKRCNSNSSECARSRDPEGG